MQHNDVIRESFTTQAQAFAANPWVTDEERIRRLVAAARLAGTERVLDIATGPGYIAEAFAGAAREVVGTLTLSELLQLFRDSGIETDSVATSDDLTPEVERWLATTKTPPNRAREVRRLLEEDRLQDLSGTHPFQDATGRLFFHVRTAILAGRKVS